MQTQNKNTRGKVRSVLPSLVWHATKNEKKEKKEDIPKFERKTILSALAGIKEKPQSTVIDPI